MEDPPRPCRICIGEAKLSGEGGRMRKAIIAIDIDKLCE